MAVELQNAIARIRGCSPTNSTKCDDRPRAALLLTREQSAWLAWRNASCDLFAFGMEHTSAEVELRMSCRIEKTRMRIKYLKAIGTS